MRGTTPMNMGACIGLRETIAVNRSATSKHGNFHLNQYAGKKFFDGENYRAAIERLDGGYDVATDFIECMQDYCDNERENARNLIAFSEKWSSRLKEQSSLVSYHTTKRAQLDMIRLPKQLAKLKQSNCDEMQKVIDHYRSNVHETYISERFRPGRKHRRTNEFKKLFKAAHAPLTEITNQLETLRSLERKAREALHAAESASEILHLDPTTTEKQLARADDAKDRKQEALDNIEQQISEMKIKHKSAQKVYRKRAYEIFKQCQAVEEERLERTRETLFEFIQVIDTTKYSTELTNIFEGLKDKITTQQNSFDDIVFWAKTYGIENKLTKSLAITSHDDDDGDGDGESDSITECRTKKKTINHESEKNDKRQSLIEKEADDEDTSVAINSTTQTKIRVRRTKHITNTDKNNNHATEPSTMNNTVLNQV